MTTGIYQILNTENNKRYIGSTANINRRWQEHRSVLQRGIHYNQHLQRAWNLYGAEVFEFGIICYCPEEELIQWEQFVVDFYVSKILYNICPVAGSQLGIKHSEKTKRKMSRAQLGKHHSEETKKKISQARKGKHLSEKTKKKMSRARSGENCSAKTRKKMSQAQLGNTKTLGHKHSKKTKRKIGLASLGRQAKPYPSFIDPSGVVYPPGINLRAFCRKHKLNASNMCSVKNRKYKQCKGWRLK